jgi:hypothetical protein
MRITAPIFAELQILHHYFLNKGEQHYETMDAKTKLRQISSYELQRFLELIPTPDCLQQLRNYGLRLHPTPTGFILSAKALPGNDQKPLIAPDDNLRLTFILQNRDEQFFNYSTLGLQRSSNKILLFHNLKKTGTSMALSKAPAQGNPSLPYASDQDLIDVFEPLHHYTPQVANDATIKIVRQSAAVAPEVVLEEPLTIAAGKNSQQLDLRAMPSGWYQLTETKGPNSTTQDFFLNNRAFERGTLGVVVLFGKTTSQNAYAPLTAVGNFKDPGPTYVIRFENRSTTWRYHFRTDQTIVPAQANVDFENVANKKILISTANLPLTANGKVEVKTKNGKENKLPNPDARMINPDLGSGTIYSEIYL